MFRGSVWDEVNVCSLFFAFKIDLHSLQTRKRRSVPRAVVGMFSKIHFEKFVILWFRSPGLSKIPRDPIHFIFPTLLNIENTTSCNSACNVPAMAMLSSRHICLVVVVVVCCLIQTSLRAMASDSSVHSAAVNEVHLVPIDIIIRPIPPVLEEAKVNSLIKTIQVGSNDSNVERLYGIMITIHAS